MKNILLIGVGGTGSNAVDMLYNKIATLGKNPNNRIVALVFDTDAGDISRIESATAIPMADPNGVGKICDDLGVDALHEWFPHDDNNVRKQEMIRGASQWRKKSFLAFMNLMNKAQNRSAFHNAMDSLFDANVASSYELYTIASLAGGTGSGSFIPVTLYAKRYIKSHLGKDVQSSAVLACPDIYESVQTNEENRTKVYSNAYAILRELNAINLVSHGYNRPNPNAKEHHPNVKFKIGHENSPVGVLFDADKEEFWTPEAAPFDKIFLLDKIPGITSVQAHDVVLANSLYTVLCTEIGSSIDSEVSNHATLNSQNNGYNAIYAGIATSELRYPVDSVLEYLAHRQALEASNKEWVYLHKKTEKSIREEQRLAAEMRRQYAPKRGDYADKFLVSVKQELETPTSMIDEIIRRGSEYTTREGNKPVQKKYLADYYEVLGNEIRAKIPSPDVLIEKVSAFEAPEAIKMFDGAEVKKRKMADFQGKAADALKQIVKYYKECLQAIHDSESSLSDAILTFDPHNSINGNETLSVLSNVLFHNGAFIHPVAAITELCSLQKELLSNIEEGFQRWPDIRNYDKVNRITNNLCVDANGAAGSKSGAKKSAYKKLKNQRLLMAARNDSTYLESKTSDVATDTSYLKEDAKATLLKIQAEAQHQLVSIVYDNICNRLEELIAQYRNFFSNFEEERINLQEKTEATLRTDAGHTGSIVNVGSGIETKKAIYEKLNEGVSGPSMQDIISADGIAGRGVFEIVYAMAQEKFEDGENARMSSAGFDSLFEGMVGAYKEQIRKNSNFIKLAGRNVFEAIADECGRRASSAAILKAEKKAMQTIIELARPSLMIDNYSPDDGTPAPSTVTVILLSSDIAKYLKRHAEMFGLTVGYEGSEEAACRSCAEQFVANAGGHGVRVAIVDEIPSNVVYVTSEVIDVQPMHIKKIDEMSTDPVYFRHYQTATTNIDKYETDMWNPHLGYNLHRRGFLPYINPSLEKENDTKLMKALLYGIMEGKLSYHKPLRQALAFRYTEDGIERQIADANGNTVNRRNISALVSWLRPQTERIEAWCAEFDSRVESECKQLPQVSSEEERIRLEAKISGSSIIKKLRDNLFETNGKMESLSLIEFAYAFKTSEEAENDCDDAEKILRVGYDTLCKYCAYRIPVEKNPGLYGAVYCQQLGKFYESLAMGNSLKAQSNPENDGAKKVTKADAIRAAARLAAWANENDCFKDIPVDNMLDAKGKIVYVNYKYPNVKDDDTDTDTVTVEE